MVLGLERVGRNDNFFELGGHSLQATKVMSVLRERIGVDLPVRLIFESPTPAALVERLTSQSWAIRIAPSDGQRDEPGADYDISTRVEKIMEKQRVYVKTWTGARSEPESFIVTLNERGSRKGLFWCLQGHRELTQLAEYLGSDQPIHGMRSGHLVMDYTEENIRAIARHYVEEMIALQPEGSFVVGGNCQGGVIAYAIAVRLQEIGRDVSLLFLMEQGWFPSFESPVALIFGRDSQFNPYTPGTDPDATFRASYPAGYSVDIISGGHGQFFESPNVETLAEAIGRRLAELTAPQADDSGM
jgi:acyl carrier protein